MANIRGSDYEPIRTPRLHERVVQQIARRIVAGDVASGTALPTEPELAQQFGVSRTVIREAVRVLAAKGLVTVKHGRGMLVQEPVIWDNLDPLVLFERVRVSRDENLLDELFEVRRVVEVEVAALAANRRTEADLATLQTTLEGMRGCLSSPDAYTRLDISFHDQIMVAARNRFLQQVLSPVFQALKVGRAISIRHEGALPSSQQGHEEIFAAIRDRQEVHARAAMRKHISQFEGDIRASLQIGIGPDVLARSIEFADSL